MLPNLNSMTDSISTWNILWTNQLCLRTSCDIPTITNAMQKRYRYNQCSRQNFLLLSTTCTHLNPKIPVDDTFPVPGLTSFFDGYILLHPECSPFTPWPFPPLLSTTFWIFHTVNLKKSGRLSQLSYWKFAH